MMVMVNKEARNGERSKLLDDKLDQVSNMMNVAIERCWDMDGDWEPTTSTERALGSDVMAT